MYMTFLTIDRDGSFGLQGYKLQLFFYLSGILRHWKERINIAHLRNYPDIEKNITEWKLKVVRSIISRVIMHSSRQADGLWRGITKFGRKNKMILLINENVRFPIPSH